MKRSIYLAFLIGGALSACSPNPGPIVVERTVVVQITAQPTAAAPATLVPTTTHVPATPVPPTSVPPTSVPPTVVPATPVPAQPTAAPVQATSPIDAVKRFLAAAQADRSGAQAIVYTDADLHSHLQSGHDIGSAIGEQNPFTGFVVDQVVSSTASDATVQATLSYGSEATLQLARLFTVKQAGGVWRVSSIVPLADTMQPDERNARDSLAQFINLLSTGQYANAAAFYGGDYQILRDYNPDITGDPISNPSVQDQAAVQAQLLERGCTVNGFLCLPQRRIVGATRSDTNTFIVEVELNNRDGSQYSNPANGGAPFSLRVQRIGGQWFVLDIPFAS